ncbi:MAG TPA: TonB-dependent receptor [Allosphingosinicella sp.]|nr:TonB-dependent receptor [Allosphingosinicella sp.]
MLSRLHALRTGTLFAAASVAAIALASPAYAQDEPAPAAAAAEDEQNIIVTATLREQSLIDVPFSINAQTEEDIQRANASTLEDLSRNVAGLTIQNLGPGQSQVSIRGVSAGQIVRDQPGVKEQVGVYLDDSVVSLSLFTPDLDLFDLNRVETLRGPQGTLFGSGSVGGTIRYITNQPRLGVTEGQVEASLNDIHGGEIGYHLKGAVNVPMGDTVAIRAVAYGTHYGGFIDAVGPASDDNVNDGSRVGGRLAIRFQPSSNITITPRVVYQEIRTDGFNREERYHLYANQFTDPQFAFDERQQYLKLGEEFRDETLIADLTARIGLGAVELASITSYINREILVSRDASALTGSVGISFTGLGVDAEVARLNSNLVDTTDLEQWTQEVRLASAGDGPLQWVIGGFYTDINRQYSQRLPTPGYDNPYGLQALNGLCTLAGLFCQSPGVPMTLEQAQNGFPLNSPYNADLPYDIQQTAVFGEASYDFGDFRLTAGGRYYDFEETRDFVSGGVFSNRDTRISDRTASNGFSPRVILTYEPNDDLRLNLQAAKGFRLGGVNDPLNIPLCTGGATGVDAQTFGNRPTYEDETLWNYEAGIRYEATGLSFSAAAFYTDISNLQVTADAGSCSSRIVFNVPEAHTMGVEAEVNARPVPGLELSLAASVIEAEFDSDVTTTAGDVIAGIREGNRLPTVPEFQMAATATYGQRLTANSEWYVSASYQHVGSRYTQPGDQEPGAGSFNFIFFDPNTGDFGTSTQNFGSLRLPAYDLVNLSAGVEWENGLAVVLFVNNTFDENARLSLDRERGGRARIGYNVNQPRTFGITVRKRFGS